MFVVKDAMILICYVLGSCHVNHNTRSIESQCYPNFIMICSNSTPQMQRDLYIAMRDLFIRHDRLSGDNVERLKKRIEGNQLKLETYRSAQKEGWQAEVDKLTTMIERDQAMISSLLSRRIFIRAS